MLWCYMVLAVMMGVVILYGLLEVHYFLRMAVCVFLARFFKRKRHILDATNISGICLSNDIDTLLCHMNNARYLRELDFARVDFYERTNLYRTITSKGGSVFQGAATIRYRRFIRPYHRFQIASRIIYWDDQSIYMEHRFLQPSDKFVHCIAICRQRIINCSADEVMNELITSNQRKYDTSSQNNIIDSSFSLEAHSATQLDQAENGQVGPSCKLRPKVPTEVMKWIEYNDLSSKNLRQVC